MKKIPTLFRRDFTEPSNGRYVTREVTPGCEWVLAGEGVATRKYDGTCVMFDGAAWWARREVKGGKREPAGFVAIETDDMTDKTVGWEPAEQSAFAKYVQQAIESHVERRPGVPAFAAGTYELCGPKVNGNPEDYQRHLLIRHEDAERADEDPRTHDAIREFLTLADVADWEGIVWHHPDGRMAKIKRRDFRAEVPR